MKVKASDIRIGSAYSIRRKGKTIIVGLKSIEPDGYVVETLEPKQKFKVKIIHYVAVIGKG